jgi:RHS repeat-associated protein
MSLSRWFRWPSTPTAKVRPSRLARRAPRWRRPWIEQLEQRIMPDTVSWAAPVSGNWTDTTKWSTGKVPAAGDTVVIDKTGSAYTVTLDADETVAGFTLNSADARFSLSGRTFAVNGPATLNAGAVTLANATWAGIGTLTSNIDLTLQNHATIASPFINTGTVTLNENLTISYTTYTNTGTFTIASGQTLTLNGGGGTFLQDGGTLSVNGTLNVANKATFALDGGTLGGSGSFSVNSATFAFNGGSSTLGPLPVTDAALKIGPKSTGAASFVLYGNCTLSGDVAAAQTLAVVGTGNPDGFPIETTLTAAAGFTNFGTITLVDSHQYRGYAGAHLAFTSGTLTNAKTGVLSFAVGNGAASSLTGDLSNDGTVTINQSTKQAGTITNRGRFTIAAGQTLLGRGSGVTFRQEDGTLTVDGALRPDTYQSNNFVLDGGTLAGAGSLTVNGGTFTFNGGSSTLGPLSLTDAALKIGPASTGAASFVLYGNSTLSGDVAQAQTLAVVGTGNPDGFPIDTTLTAAASFTNNGTITLVDSHPSPSRGYAGANLTITSGTLTNAKTGVISFAVGNGAASSLTGDLSNDGTVTINQSTKQAGTITNRGRFTIAAGQTLLGSGQGVTFRQEQGTLTVDGALRPDTYQSNNFVLDGGTLAGAGYVSLSSGTFTFNGGSSTLPSVGLTDSALKIGPGSVGAASFVLYGNCTLSGDVAQAQTLAVVGTGNVDGFPIDSTLTAAASFSNYGAITVADSHQSRGYAGAHLTITSGALTNAATGVISVTASGGAPLSLSGNLSNAGTVNIDMDTPVPLAGGAITNAASGVINLKTSQGGGAWRIPADVINDGTIRINYQVLSDLTSSQRVQFSGAFTNNGTFTTSLLTPGGNLDNGGASTTVTGSFTNNGTIDVDAGTIQLAGPFKNLSGTTLTGGTYVVRAGVLQIPGSVTTNAAAVVLDGAGSRFDALAGLAANAAGGSLTLQNGRNLSTPGAFSNAGTVALLGADTLTVNGGYTQASTGTLTIGLAGSPTSGQFGRLKASGPAALDGTLDVRLLGGFGPGVGQSFPVMSFPSHTGDFAAVSGVYLGRAKLFEAVRNPTEVHVNALASAADLSVDPATIQVPASAQPGQNVTISYTVKNLATTPATGSWVDSVYLSTNSTLDPAASLIGRVTHTGDVSGGASYSQTLTVPLPAATAVIYHVIVVADSHGLVADTDRSNNTAASLNTIQVQVAVLTLGQTFSGTIGKGQDEYFRLDVPSATDVSLVANFVVPAEADFYVRYGAAPDASAYNFVASNVADLQQEIRLVGTAGTYYVRLHGRDGAGTTSSFTLTPQATVFAVSGITPNHGSNVGQTTLTLSGSGFTSDTTVQLAAGNTVLRASAVTVRDSTTLFATFNLVGKTAGAYDVQVENASGKRTLAGAFTVTTGRPGKIEATISTPEAVRVGHGGTVRIDYANTGDTDVVAGLLVVEADTAVLDPPPPTFIYPPIIEVAPAGSGGGTVVTTVTKKPPHVFSETALQMLAISPDGPAGVLPPGAHSHFEFPFTPTVKGTHVETDFTVSAPANLDSPVGWDKASIKATIKPPLMSDDAWNAVYPNLVAMAGGPAGTLRQYASLLAANATALSQLGRYTPEVSKLFGFILQQIDNAIPFQPLAVVADAAAPTPGLALTFTRTYLQPISNRYALDPFGRGWSSKWDITATKESNGNIDIHTGTSLRTFTPLIDGSFQSAPGDPGVLTKQGNGYRLLEIDGTITDFGADGKVSSITDRDGNAVQAGYTHGLLTSLVASSGATFTIHYNDQGRIDQLTDQAGQKTTYSYDASGEHLLSVTSPRGVTSYTYLSGQGLAREHALASITQPDGTHVYYHYDDMGRLTGSSRDGSADAVAYAYPAPGAVSSTDALADTTTAFFNDVGELGAITDPLGRTARIAYDANNHPVSVTYPDNTVVRTSYDDRGNLISQLDPLGHAVQMKYDPTFNQLVSVQDPLGHVMQYVRDGRGNVINLIYADGSAEHFSYNAQGQVTEPINRRGQVLRYTYNANGLVTRRDHGDGTHEDYAYNAAGNLLSATDSQGTTTLSYDTANRLTLITYPSGRFLQFVYDAGDRRTQMIDQDGFTVNYHYDAAGRLDRQTDATGALIVAYTYDAAGRIARKDLGNGTFTTYTYDAAGQVTSLVNHAPDGSSNSFFTYTYDDLGRRISMTTGDGVTHYGYDVTGQLTSVVLPGGRTITYAYDAAGNRTSVTDGGVVTPYATNDLNQYTTVGSATYSYDADGNLTTTTDGGRTTRYTYDDLARLVSVASPTDTWNYQYDALDGRVATIQNGQATQYLIDPTGLGNVAAEYEGSGGLRAHYVFTGSTLVSRTAAGGAAAFYDFDGTGSTAGLTGSTGHYVNQYTYLPFGERLRATETIPNPFTFSGQFGVTQETNGLEFMRERFYSSSEGRFLRADPIGIAGGLNLYRYVQNNPVTGVDPIGLIGPISVTIAPTVPGPLSYPGQLLQMALREGYTLEQFEAAYSIYVEAQGAGTAGAAAEATVATTGTVPGGFIRVDLFAPLVLPTLLVISAGLLYADTQTNGEVGRTAGEFYGNVLGDLYRDKLVPYLADLLSDSQTQQIAPGDPNDISGPAGFGDQHFVRPDATLPYTIYFENKASATAAAQVVTVTQKLDPNLDFHTFELGDFGFGNFVGRVPAGQSSLSARFDARQATGFFVDVTAGIDFSTGTVTWTFTSIDPKTLDIPSDPFPGFLPPDTNPPNGEAFVTYRIRPRANASTAARINALATVVFDEEPPLDTAPVFNAIDAGPPTSHVAALPAQSPTTFTVRWSGQDDAGGSGIASYDVFVSDNGGPFVPFVQSTTQTSATFTGQKGHTYGFYSVATDNVGHVQPTPAGAQATTLVPTLTPTTTQVTSDHASGSVVGQAVTFTASVKASATGTGSPTGSVQFQIDASNFGSPVKLSGGTAAIAVSSLAAGSHRVTAVYTSDSGAFGNSQTSSPFSQAVAPATPTGTGGNSGLTGNQRVVDDLFHAILGRAADAGGLGAFAGLLERGVSREYVALALENSPEARINQVEALYHAYLGRAADPSGLSASTDLLMSGATAERLQAAILGSPEYFNLHGGSNVSFLEALYHDALGRNIDPGGLALESSFLQQGASRSEIAQDVLTSREGDAFLVQTLYRTMLHRDADPAGLDYVITALQNGVRVEGLVAGIAVSDEFWAQL